MKEIICIENEILLSRIESELNEVGIEYFIKKTDISSYPSSINKIYFAILFSDVKNRDAIIEIYENIKVDNSIEIEEKKNKSLNRTLKNVILLFLFVILVGIIINLWKTNNNLNESINNPDDIYTYKYLQNGKALEVYSKKENRLVRKYIDENGYGIYEIIEIYLPNGFIEIYEDNNENGYSEIIRTYKNGELLIENISTFDNGIYDITNYYKNGILVNTLLYDEEKNNIILK